MKETQTRDASINIKSFDCGTDSLNSWIWRQSLKNELSGASRSFVVCEESSVVGIQALLGLQEIENFICLK
nr:hypothetical protein [uncultured Dethiosulfovibrio sp.]